MNKITFLIQLDRTGNKFLQRGIFPQIQSELATIIYDSTAMTIYELIVNNKGTMPVLENNMNYLITISWDLIIEHKDITERINNYFPASMVLFIARSQSTIIPSFYKYAYMKLGGILSYRSFANKRIATPYYEYDRGVKRLMRQFGSARFKVLFFEDMKRDVQSYVASLLRHAGIMDAKQKIVFDTIDTNASPSDFDIAINLLVNRIFFPFSFVLPNILVQKSNYFVANVLQSFASRIGVAKLLSVKLCDDPAIATKIQDRYANSNRRLFDILGVDPSTMNYPVLPNQSNF